MRSFLLFRTTLSPTIDHHYVGSTTTAVIRFGTLTGFGIRDTSHTRSSEQSSPLNCRIPFFRTISKFSTASKSEKHQRSINHAPHQSGEVFLAHSVW